MRARLLFAVSALLALELFGWPSPLQAGQAPAWVQGTAIEDHAYKYYVGRATDPDEAAAFRKAYEDAMEQAISANFGSRTSISSQSYEDLGQGTHTRRVEVRLPEVALKDFEQIGYHRDGDTLWVRFRYGRQAIEEERKRLAGAPPEASSAVAVSSGSSVTGGGVRVTTVPEDVTVFIDDERWGSTPLLLERKLSPGRHTLRLEHPHFNPVMEQLIVSPGEVQEITKTMNRARGTLRIDTTPIDGATVFMDGNLVGRTPLEREVYAGIRTAIRAEHAEAEPIATEAAVARDEVRGISLNLVLKPCTLSVSSEPPGAEVSLDGEPAGTTPVTLQVPARRNVCVSLKKKGFVDASETIYLPGGNRKNMLVVLTSISRHEQELREQERLRAAREEEMRKQALERAEEERVRKRDFPWVTCMGIGYVNSPFSNFDSGLMGYYLSVEKRFFGMAGVLARASHMLDWNSSNTEADHPQSLYGAEFSAALPVHLTRSSFTLRPEMGRFTGRAKTVTNGSVRNSSTKQEVSSLFYGISAGYSPWAGSGFDISAGVRKYRDSESLKGRVVFTFTLGGGFSI